MTSITITVDDETAAALRRLAATEQRSEADIVRTVVKCAAATSSRLTYRRRLWDDTFVAAKNRRGMP